MAKQSLKERLKAKKADLKNNSKGGGNLIFLKEGTLRVRPLPVGKDEDFVMEVVQFYLGAEIKGIISPATFGMPCAIMEKYESLKKSKDDDDKALAKILAPKNKYLLPVAVYKDEKGKELDEERSGRFVQITASLYNEIIDLFLDEDDWGDFTDPEDGYDLKLTREGKGKLDTEYTVSPCKNTAGPKGWSKPINLEEMVKGIIPTYEETEEYLAKFLNTATPDAEEDESESRRKRKDRNKDKEERKGKKSRNDDM